MKKIFILFIFLSVVKNTSAQNVGIGTTTPAEKLDVNGNVNVSGQLKTSSAVIGPSTASGNGANAIGFFSVASGTSSIALGSQTTASGSESFTTGLKTVASGQNSTAMGVYGNTNGYARSFNINGSSNAILGSETYNTAPNQMMMNFNDYVFWTNTPNTFIQFLDGGKLYIKGTTYYSHFNFSTPEDTYIRGGKASSNVIIGDLNNAVLIGTGGAPLSGDKLTVAGGNMRLGGSLLVTSNICAFGTIGACSDIRYKKNFSSLQNPLKKIQKLNAIYYNWKQDEFPSMHFNNERQLGLSAQEVEKLFPEIVQTNADGYKAVDYSRLTPVLIEGMKEQQQQIEMLQKENTELKIRLDILEKIILKK
jgi:trimeric autotransporter adhesin